MSGQEKRDRGIARGIRTKLRELAEALNEAEEAGLRVEDPKLYRGGDEGDWYGYVACISRPITG